MHPKKRKTTARGATSRAANLESIYYKCSGGFREIEWLPKKSKLKIVISNWGDLYFPPYQQSMVVERLLSFLEMPSTL
jgi:hypothetical protein